MWGRAAGAETSRGKITLTTQVSYGAGQIAGQILRDVPSLLLLFFMTNVLGISAAIAGTAIFLPKLIVGAFGDVLIGIIADRFKQRVSLYVWLIFGAVTAPISLLLLFNVPSFGTNFQVAYIVVVLSLYMLVFASFSVPYLAIAAVLSNDEHQRTVLMAWRLVFTAIGILIAGGLAPAFIAQNGGGASAYSLMAMLLGALCFFSLVIAFWGARAAMKRADGTASDGVVTAINLGEMFRAVRVPRFAVLVFANVLQLTGTGMSYAAMLYFLTYTMALEDPFGAIGIVILLTTIGIIAAQPIWVAVAKRTNKKFVYITAALFHGLALVVLALTAQSYGMMAVYICSFLIGVGNSGWVMIGFSMVADIAGEARAGLYSAVWIAADKIGFALGGTLIAGNMLSAFGFDSQRAVMGLGQPDSALTGIVLVYAGVPAILYFVGAAILCFWWHPPRSEKGALS